MSKPEPSIFDEVDPEFDAARAARAEADIAAGRLIPHEEVMAWVKTWGQPDEKPMPKAWRK